MLNWINRLCASPLKYKGMRIDGVDTQVQAAELKKAGFSIKKIAELQHRSRRTVQSDLREYRRRADIKPEPRFTGRIRNNQNLCAA